MDFDNRSVFTEVTTKNDSKCFLKHIVYYICFTIYFSMQQTICSHKNSNRN